jgi:hypothetical protein
VDVGTPFQALFPAVDSDVLAVLTATDKPRTGREIARVAHRSQPATQKVLDRLVESGLALREDAGSSRIYWLNRDHLGAPGVESLAQMRAALFGRLRETVTEWKVPAVHASVFGSTARGDGDASSDIDIFLVRPRGTDEDDPAWREQVDDLATSVHRWTGNHAGISQVGERDLGRLKREEAPILDEIRSDAIEIAGGPLRYILGRV